MDNLYTKILNRKYIPTTREFNQLMGEHIEYIKFLDLSKQLEWFNGEVGDIDITELENYIISKIKDVPESVKIFDKLSHGQISNAF